MEEEELGFTLMVKEEERLVQEKEITDEEKIEEKRKGEEKNEYIFFR